MWQSYKADFHRKYASAEEDERRFANFLTNLQVADERNAKELRNGGQAVHGITKFSDLSASEFEARFLKSIPRATKAPVDNSINPLPEGVRATADWTGVYTTAVKNQGYCGSCWAFSATEQIESDYMRNTGDEQILSPEQINQCDTTSYGCSGGWSESAYDYVVGAGGLATDASYPYDDSTFNYGITGTCSDDITAVVSITGYKTISGESSMASYVEATGPLSVCLDASSWSTYTSGVMSVCGTSVDHCVQAVGLDTSSYWKVRNSWGSDWGESGYIRLAYGANTCDITNDPTYTEGASAV